MTAITNEFPTPWTRLKCAIADFLLGFHPTHEPWSLLGVLVETPILRWAGNRNHRRHFDQMSAAYQAGVDAFTAGLPEPPYASEKDVIPSFLERLRGQRDAMVMGCRHAGWDAARRAGRGPFPADQVERCRPRIS